MWTPAELLICNYVEKQQVVVEGRAAHEDLNDSGATCSLYSMSE